MFPGQHLQCRVQQLICWQQPEHSMKKRDFPLETRRFLNKHGIHIDKIFSREGRTFEI